MRIQPTILWIPRNPHPNLLERKINSTIKKASPLLPTINSFPTYLPTGRIRKIINIIYRKPKIDSYI